jgi:hypothetical protein
MKLAGVSIKSIEEDNTTHTLEQQVTLALQAVEGDRVGSQEQPAYLRTDLPKACYYPSASVTESSAENVLQARSALVIFTVWIAPGVCSPDDLPLGAGLEG